MKKTFADFLGFVQGHDLEDTTMPNCENVIVGNRTSHYFNYVPTGEDTSGIEYQLHCWNKDSGEEYIDVRLYVYNPERKEDEKKKFMMLIEFNITNRTFSMSIQESDSDQSEFQAINMPTTTTQVQNFIPNKPSKLWDDVLKAWIFERSVKGIYHGKKFFNGGKEDINIINPTAVIRKTIHGKRMLCASEEDIMVTVPVTKHMRINWNTVKCGEEFGIPVSKKCIPANWKTKQFTEGEYDIIILPLYYINDIARIKNPDLIALYGLPDNVRYTDEVVYDEKGTKIIGVKGLLKAWID